MNTQTSTETMNVHLDETATKPASKGKAPVVKKAATKTTAKTKTPAKPVAKKAATKTASKPKAKPAPKAGVTKHSGFRYDYKPGQRVMVTGNDGNEYAGRVTKVVKKKTGHFVECDIGAKGAPFLHMARPAKVRAY